MSSRRGILAREGITADTLFTLISKTILNPTLTLPLVLFARYTAQGRGLALDHPKSAHRLLLLLAIGLFNRASSLLGRGVINNFSRDPSYDWSREIVVVTGGSDGIGAIVVKELAKRGIRVVVMDVQDPTYDPPKLVTFHRCDLTSPTAIAEVAHTITTTVGAPTILINNAGVTRAKPILDTTPTDLRLTFGVNTFAHYALARAFLPAMAAKNHGMVVTVASLAAHFTAPGMVDYAASKAAAMVFHEGLAAELPTLYNAPAVRTVLVCQGYTRTRLFAGFKEGDGFVDYGLDPATVADSIVEKVLSGESGEVFLPGMTGWLARRMRSFPLWWQGALRKDAKKMMGGFKGRMVMQPSEEKGEEELEGKKEE